MSYVLFYSNDCPYSRKFIQILNQSNQAHNFCSICVDRNPRKYQKYGNRRYDYRNPYVAKYRITNVPTIIIGNHKYEDLQCFEWLKRTHQNSQIKNVSNIGINSKQNKRLIGEKDFYKKHGGYDTQIKCNKSKGKKNRMEDNLSDGKDLREMDRDLRLSQQTVTFKKPEKNPQYTYPQRELPPEIPEEMKTIMICKSSELRKKQLDNNYNKLLEQRKNLDERLGVRTAPTTTQSQQNFTNFNVDDIRF